MPSDTPNPATPPTDRIAKVMARAGVASRRDAEKMILAGRVAVNGKVIKSPALDVGPADKVTLDGKPIDAPQETRMWLYYKPLGLVTSERDEKGRQTVFDTLPGDMPRVMSVGRLDLNSEGLLLLTNDGGLKRRLELPETGWLRKYRVRVNGRPDNSTFDPLRRGIVIDGEDFQPMEISLDRQQGANAWLTVGIREGRNREIRRAMTEVKLTVNRLIRVSYGPFRLNEMQPGDVVEVKRKVLREQLGERLLTGDETVPEHAPRRPHAAAAGGEKRPFMRKSHGAEAAEKAPRKPRAPREAGAYAPRDGGAGKPYAPREGGERRPYAPREGGERRPYGSKPAEGAGPPYSGKPRDDGSRENRPPRGAAERGPESAKAAYSARKPYGAGNGRGPEAAANAPGGARKPYAGKRRDTDGGAPRESGAARGPNAAGAAREGKPGARAAGFKSHGGGTGQAGKNAPGDARKPYAGKPRDAAGGAPRVSAGGPKPAGAAHGGKPGPRAAGFKSHGSAHGGGATGRAAGFKSHAPRTGGKPTGGRGGPKPGGKPGPRSRD
jgi:23S rRNA pseudouridine2605 synthase